MYKVDINQKDYLGRTPIDYAIEVKHSLAINFFKNVGGKTSKELEDENQ